MKQLAAALVAMFLLNGCTLLTAALGGKESAARIAKGLVLLILEDVSKDMVLQHEEAVADVASLRPIAGVAFGLADQTLFDEAIEEQSQTIFLHPGQRLVRCLYRTEEILVLVDPWTVLDTAAVEKAIAKGRKVVASDGGVFIVNREHYRYYIYVQRKKK